MTSHATPARAPFSISLLELLKRVAYINSPIPLLPFFLESTTNRTPTSHSKLLLSRSPTQPQLNSMVKSQCSSFDFIDSLHLVPIFLVSLLPRWLLSWCPLQHPSHILCFLTLQSQGLSLILFSSLIYSLGELRALNCINKLLTPRSVSLALTSLLNSKSTFPTAYSIPLVGINRFSTIMYPEPNS